MSYYFFKTVYDKGRIRLRPLHSQILNGESIDTTWNVQSDQTIRSRYPIGTIFGSTFLKKLHRFYNTGKIYALLSSSSEYKDISDLPPSDEMKSEYESIYGQIKCISTTDDLAHETTPSGDCIVKTALLRMKSNPLFSVPNVEDDGFYVDSDNWFLLLRNICNQVNTLMIGPTGTGKTELIILACKKLGIPCHIYDMGSMFDPVAGLLGVHRLQKGGESVFDYAKFTSDISKPGVILLDELSRAPVTTNNILFPCLDSRRMLPVEIAGGNDLRSIKVHKDCCFVATANVGSEYTGTMSMDRALVNRFFPIELDYMPSSKEENLLTSRCGISNTDARSIVSVATNVRSLYKKQELSCSLSTRETIMAADLVADGWSVVKAMELVFLPLFEGSKADGERGIVVKSLMSE